jgi:long-subunit fatty acid transport protein
VKCFLGFQQRSESLKKPCIFFSSALQITVVGRCKAKLLMPQKAEKGFRVQINPVKSMIFLCYGFVTRTSWSQIGKIQIPSYLFVTHTISLFEPVR